MNFIGIIIPFIGEKTGMFIYVMHLYVWNISLITPKIL
jgi:hypothetical protein